MLVIDPKAISTKDLHQYILGSVAPRPIAFVSTVAPDGTPNLAPYSFFNAFSSNPPILVFSSNRRVENNTTKDTLSNVLSTREVVINVVNYPIVRQMTLASIEYPSDVSEFSKAGLTPLASDLVKPFRVKESPVQMECVVQDVITLGEHGGAGHLIVCEMVRMHVSEDVLDANGRIDPHKIDLMGRMGRAYYVRASGDAVMTIVQPFNEIGIGYDQLPESIRNSKVLTANEIAQLAAVLEVPRDEDMMHLREEDPRIENILSGSNPVDNLHRYAQEIMGDPDRRAYAVLVAWLGEFVG